MKHAGIHAVRIGDTTVTALNDGQFEASVDYIVGLDPVIAAEQETSLFRPLPPRITINAFMLEIGGKKALIDTGCGTAFGPNMGGSMARMNSLGVADADIETILITHAHIDHVSGLLTPDGAARFPNAELVITAAETGFWLDDATAAAAPESAKDSFALAKRCLSPYAARTRKVTMGQEVLPGVTCHPLPGHTPGHTGWLITSGTDSLLVWGDVVHLPGIQFAHPEAGMAFDTDADLARTSRSRVLAWASADRLMVAGMHLDFAPFGHVIAAGNAYSFIPQVWQPSA
jgi:glyoxylase-like metal-dependent hydrolase (beta-lactamase superfamily II)